VHNRGDGGPSLPGGLERAGERLDVSSADLEQAEMVLLAEGD
jgi:hypothetical protein